MSRNKKSAAEWVYEEIRDAITFSRLKPGERLLETKLCEEFKVSRTPLREALRQLQAQGYITVEQNKGAIVSKISIEEVEDLYSILALLEPYSAGKAAMSRTNKDLKRLKKIYSDMNTDPIKDDYRLWLRDNDDFHNLIHSMSRSHFLFETIRNLRNRIYRFRILMTSRESIEENLIPQHKEILDAIIEGDSVRSEECMRNHMFRARKWRVEFLKTYPELL